MTFMFKKIILLCIILLGGFTLWFEEVNAGGCNTTNVWDVWVSMAKCLEWSTVVWSNWDFSVENNFKVMINKWTRIIATILSLLAVGSIVLGAFFMTFSWGEDEKIKKWKGIVKWSIFGFLGVVTAGWLISLVVNFIFALD